MHRYEKVMLPGGVDALPSIGTYRFAGALDVVEYARLDHTIGWRTWPEVWHLNDEGRFQCGYAGSSLDSTRGWAEDPWPLHRSRQEGLRSGGCADRWLIVESRSVAFDPPVDEGDVAAFLRLRVEMDTIGVTLVDTVVFDDEQRWWSLRELTSGTTSW